MHHVTMLPRYTRRAFCSFALGTCAALLLPCSCMASIAQGIGKRPHFVLALDIKGFIKIPLRNRCGKNNALAQRLENQHGYQKMHHQGRQHQGDNCGYGTGVQIGG